MTEMDRKKMLELDEATEKAGGFLSTVKSEDICYDYRAINEYCKKKEIEPIDMTIREMNKFIVQ